MVCRVEATADDLLLDMSTRSRRPSFGEVPQELTCFGEVLQVQASSLRRGSLGRDVRWGGPRASELGHLGSSSSFLRIVLLDGDVVGGSPFQGIGTVFLLVVLVVAFGRGCSRSR